MKLDKQHSALEVIKKEQLKRRLFTVEFKAEVVRYKKAENLSLPECGRKFEVLPKLIRDWKKQYDAGRCRQQLLTMSCCLSSSDSAATAPTPSGLRSFAMVTNR